MLPQSYLILFMMIILNKNINDILKNFPVSEDVLLNEQRKTSKCETSKERIDWKTKLIYSKPKIRS